jgi:Protein of unknown function (DUF3102)
MGEVERSLDALAEEINAEHRAFLRAAEETFRAALRAGDLLNEAKAEAGHGNWTTWVEENCVFSMRSAQVYMQLANNRTQVEEMLKSAEPAHLSIERVIRELAPPKGESVAEPTGSTTLMSAWAGETPIDKTKQLANRFKNVGLNPQFARWLAQGVVSAEKELIVEAVAEVNDISSAEARQHYQADVSAIRDAVENEKERRDARGDPFDASERADYARRIATMKKRSRDAAERNRQERRKRHTEMFFEMDALLGRARREIKEALHLVREGIEFDEEEVELLERQNEALQAMSKLVGSALSGDSGTDWDAELARLEERRQWGAEGEDDEAKE